MRKRLLLRLPSHQPRLAVIDQALLLRIEAQLREGGLRPLIAGELGHALGMERDALLLFLERVSRLGYLEPVPPTGIFCQIRWRHLAPLPPNWRRRLMTAVSTLHSSATVPVLAPT